MSSTTLNFLMETGILPFKQQIKKYSTWLAENPNSEYVSHIQNLLNNATQQNQEIAQKNQEIAQKNQEIHKKDQILASRSLGSIKTNFPAKRDRTDTGPHLSENHPHANVHEISKTDHSLQSVHVNWLDTKFWETGFIHLDTVNCNSESTTQRLVVGLVQSVLNGLGLDQYVEVVENRTLAGSECDILLVYRATFLPFAVIEVKKPCNTYEDRRRVWFGEKQTRKKPKLSNKVAGQIFDAMSAIQLFGFPQVCGLITTWNHSRLVGTFIDDKHKSLPNVLAGIEQLTNSKTTLQEIQKRFQVIISQDSSKRDDDKDSPEQPKICFNRENGTVRMKRRVVWASKIVPSFDHIPKNDPSREDKIFELVKKSGKSIVSLVSLFVVKSSKLLVDFLQANDISTITIPRKVPCRVLKEKKKVFAFASIGVEDINISKFNERLKCLYVIRHLGMGECGSCCLAISKKGASCCVVKFFHRPNSTKESVQRECSNWNTVYASIQNFPKCRIFKAAEGYCLVMPYLRPIPKKDRWQWIGSIEETLKLFCCANVLHPEVRWRHIGLWQDRAFFLDLGNLTKDAGQRSQLAWRVKSLESLQQKAGLQTPSKNKAKKSDAPKKLPRNRETLSDPAKTPHKKRTRLSDPANTLTNKRTRLSDPAKKTRT
jgi:hypothetical protein